MLFGVYVGVILFYIPLAVPVASVAFVASVASIASVAFDFGGFCSFWCLCVGLVTFLDGLLLVVFVLVNFAGF